MALARQSGVGVRRRLMGLVGPALLAEVHRRVLGIVVRTRRAGDEVLIEVLDRGPGIPVAERKRIFEAFYRVGNENTRSTKGTGLGLHLVALQAEAMGGSVEVEERSGGGTLFRVHLRLA